MSLSDMNALSTLAKQYNVSQNNMVPDRGKPRCTVDISVSDTSGESTWRVIGYDMRIAELELLEAGDCVAVQGTIQMEESRAKNGCRTITVTHMVAGQILMLRVKSPNRLPVRMADQPML